MTFNKKAKKGEIIGKVKADRDKPRAFEVAGLWAGRFTLDTDPAEITRAYIGENMTVAMGGEAGERRKYSTTHYQSSAFPGIWMRSLTQAS
ncbi:hypothetical protein SAMN04488020_107235 [Palleronia marisminoris]|uniref:Uncharacterized protein n=1 Tax=Palleronia marisminoris TaxID=315423 RepID=A0A1Y5TAV3_9RHOB|nr:hypothetical protein [Palleronia marisminoris]SFH17829.1 hypothetical protein SAMN04488020_107235 [Palleronia marisminoris]SLN56188.1 hypothetical protein PAM7066_02709 [Palleronia marisminoris]